MTHNITNAPKTASALMSTTEALQDGPASFAELIRLMRCAADALEAAADTLPAEVAATPLPIQNKARTTGRYLFTDWPRVLPRGTQPESSKLFDAPAYRDVYRRGPGVEVYVGAGAGYKRISRNLCLPFYKVGMTEQGGLVSRFKQHKAERYGSFWCQDGLYKEDPDFSDQFPGLIQTFMRLSPHSPVRPTRNSIVVSLPDTLTPLDFEMRLRQALAPCAVHEFLAADPGLRHCRLLNIDPSIGLRMTGYGFGDVRRMTPADEIYTIRPMIDGDALLVVCEEIVLRHIGLLTSAEARLEGGK